MIEERNRASEAANTESARADQAEAHAKQFYQDNAKLRTEIQTLEYKIDQKEEALKRLGIFKFKEKDALKSEINNMKIEN